MKSHCTHTHTHTHAHTRTHTHTHTHTTHLHTHVHACVHIFHSLKTLLPHLFLLLARLLVEVLPPQPLESDGNSVQVFLRGVVEPWGRLLLKGDFIAAVIEPSPPLPVLHTHTIGRGMYGCIQVYRQGYIHRMFSG